MKIYTIIVTYNAMKWIDKCLDCLYQSTVKTDIIIIDNLSTDGTKEYIPNTYKQVIWLPQTSNMGFGQGNNVGIRYAIDHHADYVLLLNQDAYIHPKAIENMLKAADGESLISPMQLNGTGDKLDNMFSKVILSVDISLIYDTLVTKEMKTSYKIGETGAACWLMPKSLIHKIGGFNPLFFQYSEDNNYYQRIKYHNIQTLFVPQAIIRHDRKVHGNMQAYNNKKIKRELLMALTNINTSFSLSLFNSFRILIRCYTYELFQKQYTPGTFLKAALGLVFKSKDIINSRKAEKELKPNWL